MDGLGGTAAGARSAAAGRPCRVVAAAGAQVTAALDDVAPAGRRRAAGGEPFTAAETGLLMEVLAGTTRHAVVTVTRLR